MALDFIDRGLLVRRFEPEIAIEKMLLFPSNKPRSRLTDAFVQVLKQCRDEELVRQQEMWGAPKPVKKVAAKR